jgi:phospholipase C
VVRQLSKGKTRRPPCKFPPQKTTCEKKPRPTSNPHKTPSTPYQQYDKGIKYTSDFVADFAKDVLADALPAVSWLVGPANVSEHANYHPSAGEDLTARLLKALAANPDVYKKTLFVFNYDEGGQFFDHAVPFTPPQGDEDGASTVSTHGESWLGLPIGPGFRVALMMISPWSRGGFVVSEAFDHTSSLKLIEKRFNVSIPNISPWRRAMLGDLTSALDFSSPDYSTDWVSALPDTSAYPAESIKECDTLPPPKLPAVQAMPAQEPGVRPARALPYALLVTGAAGGALALALNNSGAVGVPLLAYDYSNPAEVSAPRKFGVEAGAVLAGVPSLSWPAPYSVALHAPNGFAREFVGAGTAAEAGAAANVAFDAPGGRVLLALGAGAYTVTDVAYGSGGPWRVSGPAVWPWDASGSANWYDLRVTLDGAAGWSRRAMGHMENGRPSTSDPAPQSAPALHPFDHPTKHHDVPEELRQVPRKENSGFPLFVSRDEM